MKYINSCGTLCVLSEDKDTFGSFGAAVMAMHLVSMFYANLGFSVSSSIYKETKRVEVSIHFDSFEMPTLPTDYFYSRREITSQPYKGNFARPGERVRVVHYCFVF